MFAFQVALSGIPNVHITAVLIILTAVFFGWRCMYSIAVFIMLEGFFCKVLHTPLALCFGSRDSASIISILTAAVTVGASVGIPAANIVYDATGSYAGLFRALLIVLVVCLILAFTGIKKVPGWDKVGGPAAIEKK